MFENNVSPSLNLTLNLTDSNNKNKIKKPD